MVRQARSVQQEGRMMNKHRVWAVVAASTLVVAAGVASATAGAFGADRSDNQVANGSSHRQPKNVIFLLGDGMGRRRSPPPATTRASTTS
jgi:alkaline phosphatase